MSGAFASTITLSWRPATFICRFSTTLSPIPIR
jgi:hypothetical protein